MFLLWPVLLACVMVTSYWANLPSVAAYLGIVLATCLTTAVVALCCSVMFRKTAHSLMAAYLVIIVLFCVPMAVKFFAEQFFPLHPGTEIVRWTGLCSPFAAAFAVPLDMSLLDTQLTTAAEPTGDWRLFAAYMVFSVLFNVGMLGSMVWLFNVRWRISD